MRWASELTAAVRARCELAAVHIVVVAALDSRRELRDALDAGADDVIRVPFEPEVLVARVAAGLRAARLRADEALLRSLVVNIPGALYRCACDPDWTMAWVSPEIEEISGYPVTDFIDSSGRTFASVIHPDDREQVERSVTEAVNAHRPFSLEYRIKRRDGDVRWLLERGQAQESGDGRRWLDGAIFDITVRRAAEQALREKEVVEAQLAEVRASRARILDTPDEARREIERNLHDGAQQRFVSVALELQRCLAPHRELSDDARGELEGVLTELRMGLAELRDLAHGLHPAIFVRPRARAGVDDPRRPRHGACRASGRASRATARRVCRGRRVLHGLRGAHERGQARRRQSVLGPPLNNSMAISASKWATTAQVALTASPALAFKDFATGSQRLTAH